MDPLRTSPNCRSGPKGGHKPLNRLSEVFRCETTWRPPLCRETGVCFWNRRQEGWHCGVWDKAREHATNAVIGVSILVLTGFAPAHGSQKRFTNCTCRTSVPRWPAGPDRGASSCSSGSQSLSVTRCGADVTARPNARRTRVTTETLGRCGPWKRALNPCVFLPGVDRGAAVRNLSKDPAEEYFTDGMTEEFTTSCSHRLAVRHRAQLSFHLQDRAVDIKQVGREFGVRYVLEGSVRRSGNRVRITGQLLDAETGTHCGRRLDGAMEEIFELQDNIASSIVGAIEPQTALPRRAARYRNRPPPCRPTIISCEPLRPSIC